MSEKPEVDVREGMSALNETALEAAVQAVLESIGPVVAHPEASADIVARQEGYRLRAAKGHARAAVTAYLAAQWRPIETAPSDVPVLLYCPHLHATNPARIEVGVYHDTHGGSTHSWATHWMPPPPPPAQEGRE